MIVNITIITTYNTNFLKSIAFGVTISSFEKPENFK